MTGMHHDVVLDFPEYLGRIEHLRASNAQFARLFEEYRDASMELHSIEAKIEAAAPVYVEELQKRRRRLKDEIHRVLSAL
jgi:uncharacterized protein